MLKTGDDHTPSDTRQKSHVEPIINLIRTQENGQNLINQVLKIWTKWLIVLTKDGTYELKEGNYIGQIGEVIATSIWNKNFPNLNITS